MNHFSIGDIVVRQSYGGDTFFKVFNIINQGHSKPLYVLRGMLHRLEADSHGEDLIKQDSRIVYQKIQESILATRKQLFKRTIPNRILLFNRFRVRSGRILHIDSSEEFMKTCLRHYSGSKLLAMGKRIDESEQPNYIAGLLEKNKPDILVITGHDSLKKNSGNVFSMNSYSNSKYYVQSVKIARAYEPDFDKLCIFAGACQSYFEAIMDAGANFASSPGRVLINALDPAIVSEKVAITDSRIFVTPQEIARLAVSGSKGIGGIKSRGHLFV